MPEENLEPLITECPSCRTRFRVSETQLQRARGRVRCGACLTVFHGVEHLVLAERPGDADPEQAKQALDDLLDELAAGAPAVESEARREVPELTPGHGHDNGRRARLFGGFEDAADEPESPEAESPAPPVAESVPAEAGGVVAERRKDVETPAAGVAAAPTTSEAPTASPVEPPRGPVAVAPAAPVKRKTKTDPPSSAGTPGEKAASSTEASVDVGGSSAKRQQTAVSRPGAGRSGSGAASQPTFFGEVRRRRPLVWLGIVAGTLLLAAQVLWYQFDDWATRPAWRGLYGSICGVLGCELPVQQDASQLGTRNLVVRIHPQEPGSLLVNAVIVNSAEFAQPFPVLELQFTTVRGNLVASRRFHPDEYLAGDGAGMHLIPPRTPVQIELTIEDPGPDAVNYRLNFR